MKPLFQFTLLAGLVAATAAMAADGKSSILVLGGAASSPAGVTRLGDWGNGSLVAGIAPLSGGAFSDMGAKGWQTGGFLAWQADGYRVDASLAPSFDGSVVAGLGAAVGAKPGQTGTSYGLRLGAAWLGERFTVNPTSGLAGVSEVVTPTSDVNLTFTVNHALTPNLSVIGTAAARRPVGNMALEGGTTQSHFLLGAGLGYRF